MKGIQALILVCVFAAPCAAQQQQGGSKAVLGGSVGLGNSSPDLCDGCHTGIVIGLHGGAAVTPHLAIQAEGLFMSVAPNVLSKSGGRHNALLATLQYSTGARLWIKGGAGVGSVERHSPTASAKTTHAAGLAGVGVDFNPRSSVRLDLSVSALLTGDSNVQFANEPAHRSVVTTALLLFGVGWRGQ